MLLGSSRVTFADPSSGATLLDLLESDLQSQVPHLTWLCAGVTLFASPTMAARAQKLLDEHKPDLVMLEVPAFACIQPSVLLRIKRRAPVLYPVCLALTRMLKSIGGGGLEGTTSWRGNIFRFPRDLVMRVIGGETELRAEEALASTTATLDTILQGEDVAVACRLPTALWPIPAPFRREATRRLDYLRSGVADHCAQRHVACYDFVEAAKRGGVVLGHLADGRHKDRPNTELEARLVAQQVIHLLRLDGASRES